MKKVLNIVVLAVFLVSFTGISVHKHYKHGKLFSTALYAEAQSCCSGAGHCPMADMKKTHHRGQKDDCSCKDRVEVFKISDSFRPEKFSGPVVKTIDLPFDLSFHQTTPGHSVAGLVNLAPRRLFPGPLPDAQACFGVYLL